MSKLLNSKWWVSLMPYGLGYVKPHHFLEMIKTCWNNRDQLAYAWRILNQGVCDGCALGTTGMHDFTMDGIHLCMVRLNLLRLNTMPAFDPEYLKDTSHLKEMKARPLRDLGRLPYPMISHQGEKGFRRISWQCAYDTIAERIRTSDPHRLAFYLTSRGLTNEVYYVAQKVARFLGTNNIDNSARICHAPSTVALKTTLGVTASTCSYKDWIGTDLIVFVGSNVPNNQPVTTKYLYYAKQKGTKIVVVNPYREPGLDRYWIPSVFESALFGTRLADEFFLIHTGGDIAFFNGVLKHLIELNALDECFIQHHTLHFDALRTHLNSQSWEDLEPYAGISQTEMARFAQMVAQAKSAVFVWSMGITQHTFGVDNVKAIINLALARGMIGREKCGLMPIRGHSGVQGSAEMGAVPGNLPGGVPLNEERFSQLWSFDVPSEKGLHAVEMIDAAHAGQLDILYSVGGNFLETLPDPHFVREALERVPFRVHQDIVLTPQMLVDPADTVVLLPAQTRYEQKGGGTETSTERYILYSPEIMGPRIGEAKPEWEILMELAQRVYPHRQAQIHFDNAQQIRQEIAQAVPFYEGIQDLKKQGDAVQWGGPRLCKGGDFKTQEGKAHFSCLAPQEHQIPAGWFIMSTRRGKQFNSMVQGHYDPLTGAQREDIFMNEEDIRQLGMQEGDSILLKSAVGEFRGHIKQVPIKPRNIQLHWPEANILLPRGRYEPHCGIPDYNTWVQVIPLS